MVDGFIPFDLGPEHFRETRIVAVVFLPLDCRVDCGGFVRGNVREYERAPVVVYPLRCRHREQADGGGPYDCNLLGEQLARMGRPYGGVGMSANTNALQWSFIPCDAATSAL